MTFVSPSAYVQSSDGFAPSLFGGTVAARYGSYTFTDTAPKTLFTLPAGAVVLDFYNIVTTAFDDAGTDLLIVGTAADDDAYVDDAPGGAIAFLRAGAGSTTPATGLINATPFANDTPILAKYTGQTPGSATAGAATFVCFYMLR